MSLLERQNCLLLCRDCEDTSNVLRTIETASTAYNDYKQAKNGKERERDVPIGTRRRVVDVRTKASEREKRDVVWKTSTKILGRA